MKKIAFILTLSLLFISCDDGDLTLASFNFENVAIEKCSSKNIVFQKKNKETLLLEIPEDSFENEVTPAGEPRIINISSLNKVSYRNYSENIVSNTICSDLPPATPIVTKEWLATGGTIEVITTEQLNDIDELIGYLHTITFKNMNFSSTSDSFNFESYLMGTYVTSL